jgi:phage-related protein
MSDRYKGFWSPDSSYGAGDIVTYYPVSGYGDSHVFYKLKPGLSASPVRNNLGYNACPLKNFKWPVLSSGSRNLKLSADQNFDPTKGDQLDQTISEILSETTDWTQYKYYKVNVWDGPNGKTGALLINGSYWEVHSPASATPGSADTSTQAFAATGMTTVSVGTHNEAEDIDVTFDEIKDSEEGGELESDNYYISSVQNYKGYWKAAQNYKKFDIVRHRDSNKFYYARKGINSPSASSNVTGLTFHIRPPVPSLTENHVGNLEFVSHDTLSGFRDAGFESGQSIQIAGDTNTYSISMLTEKIMVLAMYQFPAERALKQLVEGDLLDSADDQALTVSIKTADLDDENWSNNSFFFDADYGSSVSFKGYNAEYEYGDGYKTVKPRGINSLSVDFNLKFTNRTSREANSILHFIENNLGQHEVQQKKYTLAYDQGIAGFNMDGDSLFFPYNNTENLTRNFYCFDFNHTIEGEDVHTISAKIFNNNTSILHRNDYLYVNRPEVYSLEQTYYKHNIVYVASSDAYYYYQGEENARGDPPSNDAGVSINKDKWTREFYWKPSTSFNVNHSPSIAELSSKASAYKQYFPRNKNNINLLSFSVTFSHRSEREAYAILHFLESHLAYKSFLFIPPAPYNRKRRFICQEWEHTYVFRDSHTITAKFEQYSLGQNTPLDDDEMDDLTPTVENRSARLSLVGPVELRSSAMGEFVLKNQIELKNTGETEAKDIVLSASGDFTLSNVAFNKEDGAYTPSYGALSRKTNTANYDNSEGGGFLYKEAGDIKSQDNLGRIGTIHPWALKADHSAANGADETIGQTAYDALPPTSAANITDQTDYVNAGKLTDRAATGVAHVSEDFLNPTKDDSLSPGESAFAEIYYSTTSSEKGEVLESLTANYTSAGEAKTTKYEITATVAQDHIVPETIDVPIEGTVEADIYKKSYTIDRYSEFDFISEDNILEVMQHSAILEDSIMAEPQNLDEVVNMLDQNGLEGNLALGITYSGPNSRWEYLSTGGAVDVNNLGGLLDDSSPNPVMVSGAAGDILVLVVKADKKNYTFGKITSTEIVDGAIFERTEIDTLSNVNLMEAFLGSLDGQGLLNIGIVNFNISGVIFSQSTGLAALDSGSGYLPGMEVNINLDSDARIIGRGGKGGTGMVSEGKMFQGDGSYDSMQDLRPPSSGEDGGNSIEISEQNSNVKFTITWNGDAKVFGGGGGGYGGGANVHLADEWPGDPRHKMNFAGSGGGGAGIGAAGPTLAEPGTLEVGGSGGDAVNNYSPLVLRGGGAGGAPGEKGDGALWPTGINKNEVLNSTNVPAIYIAMTGAEGDTGGMNWWIAQGTSIGATTNNLVDTFLSQRKFPSSGGKGGKAILYYGHVIDGVNGSLVLSNYQPNTNTKGEIGKHG